jgi:serine/threonine protein kinase
MKVRNCNLGTSRFEPPELIRREMYSGKPQDMWQVGILLFILLEGDIPFKDDDEILRAVYKLTTGVSPECQDLVMRLIEPIIERRITAAQAMEHRWFMDPSLIQ